MWLVASTPTGRYWIIGLCAFFFPVIRYPRIAIKITRLLLGPPKIPPNPLQVFRGSAPYTREDKDTLLGRQPEIDDCWRLLKEKAFFILEGESGCGKSSLLNAGLIPKAEAICRVMVCRITEAPFAVLFQELARQQNRPMSERRLAAILTRALQASNTNSTDHPEPPKPLPKKGSQPGSPTPSGYTQ